jgi:hypothetical protein
LTNKPDLPLWVDALSRHRGTPIQDLARQVLARYVAPRFKTEGRQLAGADHAELVSAALAPDAVDPRLVPAQLPRLEDIRTAQQWTRFGLVDVMYGSEPRGQSGYTMLFERRGNGWVFLCVVSSWIS